MVVALGLVLSLAGCGGDGDDRVSGSLQLEVDTTVHTVSISRDGDEICLSHRSTLGDLGESCTRWDGRRSRVVFVSAGYSGATGSAPAQSAVTAVGFAARGIERVALRYAHGAFDAETVRGSDWADDLPSIWILSAAEPGPDRSAELLGLEADEP